MKNEPRAACDAARETHAAHSAPTPPAQLNSPTLCDDGAYER